MRAVFAPNSSFFNFFGLSVTKHMSATTRMVLDSVRTLVVWGADLALGWEEVSTTIKTHSARAETAAASTASTAAATASASSQSSD